MREKGFAGFSARELKVIVWRTNGIKGPEIARRLGCTSATVHTLLHQAMVKAAVDDVCLLTRWAINNGLDEMLDPEDPADLPVPEPKASRQNIKLGRLRAE